MKTIFPKFIFAAGLLLAAALPTAHALPGNDVIDRELAQGIRLHNEAVNGDEDATDKAIQFFEEFLEQHPDDELARVYLGSAYSLKGRDIGFGPSALEALRTAEDYMNTAVSNAPDDPKVRLIRAINFLQLPAIFNKRSIARDDLQALLKRVRDPQDEAAQNLSTPVKQVIYLYAGEALRQLRKRDAAREAWNEGKALAPNSSVAARIQDKLD
jgi:tetratricopeptide (TPR) repeat protein